jgi:hypothetical protein
MYFIWHPLLIFELIIGTYGTLLLMKKTIKMHTINWLLCMLMVNVNKNKRYEIRVNEQH